jgi:hypothetical protein
MKTFILLTFGFLGFAFYEMSGGSDFEPASSRIAEAQPEDTQASETTEMAPSEEIVTTTASITKIDSTPSVTRVALNLTNVSDAADQATQDETTTADLTETPQIILPSLITTTQSIDTADSNDDIRTVSGNRVNVRGGPSTNYGIVNKLTRGEAVQVLEDNGDGWVRMQPVDGGESGWMADFLLTSG